MPERPSMWYIFGKRIVQGYQKSYSHVLNTQIQKYKYKNTQIKLMTKCQKDPIHGIFLERGLFIDIKNYIPIRYKLNIWVSHNCARSSYATIFLWMQLHRVFNLIVVNWVNLHSASKSILWRPRTRDLSEFDISDNLEWLTDFCLALSHRFIL